MWNWFKKKSAPKNLSHPVERGFYAFTEQRAGDFLAFLEQTDEYLVFSYLPGGHKFYLTDEDFRGSLKTHTIDYVEQLPEEVFVDIKKIAEQLKNS